MLVSVGLVIAGTAIFEAGRWSQVSSIPSPAYAATIPPTAPLVTPGVGDPNLFVSLAKKAIP